MAVERAAADDVGEHLEEGFAFDPNEGAVDLDFLTKGVPMGPVVGVALAG